MLNDSFCSLFIDHNGGFGTSWLACKWVFRHFVKLLNFGLSKGMATNSGGRVVFLRLA